MPEVLDDFFAEKHSIINELFVETADDNYALARWCFHQHLNVDFYWLALHALEKYLKAILLLNGKSAKSYSHDIVKLYTHVTPLAPELFPSMLVKPEDVMPDQYSHIEKVADFIARLYRDGHPSRIFSNTPSSLA
jgi:HEPN domain-containing protein